MRQMLKIFVTYSQVAVFDSALARPFNNWTEAHVDQGFSWRPGSVAFRTLTESGIHAIQVDVVEHAQEVTSEVVRAIEVPFEVPKSGLVEIASISDGGLLKIPAGPCLLRCELLRGEGEVESRIRLLFAREDRGRFSIVRADEAIVARSELLTTAEPASG